MTGRAERLGFTGRYLGRTLALSLRVRVTSRDPRQIAMVDGVRVELPKRVGGSRRDVLRPVDEDHRPIAMLLGTRHHDGHIREASVAALVDRNGWWPANEFPFLLLAVGDYVHQVADRAAAELLSWDRDDMRYLLVANPTLLALVRARSLSYEVATDATARFVQLVAEPDWFSSTLAGGVTPTWDEFDERTDARFPYFDEVAWRAAVHVAALVGPVAEWQVLHEILCPPGVLIGRDRQLAMVDAWAAQFGREPASIFLELGRQLVLTGELSTQQLHTAATAIGNDEAAHWMLETLKQFVPPTRSRHLLSRVLGRL